jgi:phosphatidylglycerol:prolipoprotein diacylglycerol transferase
MEFIFNALMLMVVLVLRRQKILPGQHFHVYLMAYGLFRFFHEFLRACLKNQNEPMFMRVGGA